MSISRPKGLILAPALWFWVRLSL